MAQSIRLAWDPVTTPAGVSYQVERGTASQVYTQTVAVAPGVNTYEFTGLTANVRYYFVVRAVNAAGLRSGPSNEVSAVAPAVTTPPPTTPPPTTPPPTEPPPTTPPPTTPPPTTTVTVKVASESALQAAVSSLRSKTIISIAKGTYQLTRPLTLTGGLSEVEIRSATGRAADVILIGPGATSAAPRPAAIVVSRISGLKLADFTIKGAVGYAVSLGLGVSQPRLSRLKIIDDGEFVQSLAPTSGAGNAKGIIEGCVFEYSGKGVNLPVGIDIRAGATWTIQSNTFTDPKPTTSVTFGPAIVAWQGSSATIIDRNIFLYTTREIVLGLEDRYPDQHKGGTIRNNMIVRKASTGARGAAISVLDSPGTVVVHNSVLLMGTSTLAIDYAHPDTQNVFIANNLLDGKIVGRDRAMAYSDSNLTTAKSNMFVEPAKGNLKLRPSYARAAIDSGLPTPFAPTDAAGRKRPNGAGVDIGASEYYQ